MDFLTVLCGRNKQSEIPKPTYELPDGFCYAHDVIDDIVLDIRYAGKHNFVGDIIDGYLAPYAVMTIHAAEGLKKVAEEFRKMGLRILIFDAYRPQAAVDHFVRWANDETDMRMKNEFYPEIKQKTLMLTQGYIAPDSSHCRGSVVDLTLTDSKGKSLDMGTGFDYFGKRAWHGAEGLSREQESNRLLLRTCMEKHGFSAYEKEWWHYKLIDEPFKQNPFNFPVR